MKDGKEGSIVCCGRAEMHAFELSDYSLKSRMRKYMQKENASNHSAMKYVLNEADIVCGTLDEIAELDSELRFAVVIVDEVLPRIYTSIYVLLTFCFRPHKRRSCSRSSRFVTGVRRASSWVRSVVSS